MIQATQSSFDEIKAGMKKNLFGRICLDLASVVARLNFLLSFGAWIIRASSIIMELVLLVASPIIMVSVSLPGFDSKHPGDLYTWALKALVAAADVLVPGGLFSIIEKFIHKQKIWAFALLFFWLVLTVLTFVALAEPMGVVQIDATGLKQLLYWRTIDSLVYSALSLVAIVYTVRNKTPDLTPQQQDAIASLSQTVVDLTKQVNTLSKPEIDYGQIASTLSSLNLPENVVTSDVIRAVEDRILSQLNEQNNEVISLINNLLKTGGIMAEITEENTPELEAVIIEDIYPVNTPVKTPDISANITSQISEKKEPKLPQEKPDHWSEVIAKFPGVMQWQSEGLRSVSVEQIIEVTTFSKNKIGRANLPQTKNKNKRIESVLIWLKNTPVNTEVKKEDNTEPLNPEIMAEITEENTPELEEVITGQKSRETIKLSLDDLPPEIEEYERRLAHTLKVEKDWEDGKYKQPLSEVVDEGVDFVKQYYRFQPKVVITDPELAVVEK